MRLSIANKINISFGRETMVKLLLCTIWAVVIIGYSKGIINKIPVLGDFSELVQASMIVIPLLLALPALINKFCLADYLFYFIWVIYYLSCYIAYPGNTFYLNENIFICLCCVFPYYFIGRLTDINVMFNWFVLLSAACVLMDLFYYLAYAPSNKNMAEMDLADNMYRAYRSLPNVAMLLWATLDKFRVWKCILSFLGLLFLLSCGTRGPLACLVFFCIIYFLFFMNFKGAIYVKGIIVSVILFIIFFIKEIVQVLALTFLNLNLSTRILEKFITGDLGNDSQRSGLRDILYSVLDNGDHFFGLGFFGCRNYGVIYPHFLPLDLATTFGYFVGYTLFALLMVLVGGAIWCARSQRSRAFILVLCSISVIKLMFSNTFVLEPYLFMLIGVSVSEISNVITYERKHQ